MSFGNRITPSYVAWTDEDRLVENLRRIRPHETPRASVYVVKRLIGRNFDDQEFREISMVALRCHQQGASPIFKARSREVIENRLTRRKSLL